MKVLLTGALGYIGSAINHILIQNGFSVVGVDLGLFTKACFYREDMWHSRALMERLIRKDLRDVSSDDLQGCDAVVDFAGLANDPSGELSSSWTEEINHQASVRLAKLAREHGISRYLFASSCSVYGSRSDRLLTEESSVEPVSEYAKAKVAVEREVLPLANTRFFPTILRNATAYGASPRMRFDLVLNNLTAYAYTTGIIKVFSDGTAWRPNVHVEDIALAVLAILESPTDEVRGRIFNVGSDSENYQVRTMATMVSEIMPSCRIEAAPGAGKDPRSYRVSFRRLSALKSLVQKWNVRSGVDELKKAFEHNQLTYEMFQDPEYHNVKKIRELISQGKFDSTLRFRVSQSSP